MEGVLWYLLASSRGAKTRVRLLRALEHRPQNANQLSNALEMDYSTIRHHLKILVENNILQSAGNGYGEVYLFTEQAKQNWDTVERILNTVEGEE
ncbi:winged helix-turn-helix domain-containing protein [Natronocalculus amylovorans]|uniref:Winged helix-turn-helix domain-containing protein n=1 Tax=Natronocalculus amylovorans TaxID=2917812 RepID=A0AAE3FVZ4_9EURY|nr:winged helix-turn-helix domain-containing protein [Natronocalculus amylovorans]MCL9816201.1 winged helix-turn-helix domain-containing protein [Natronocalculus amylovorans]